MNKDSTLDPFESLPFSAYLNAATGQQEHYQSLAQFIHAERLRGADENYRDYLLRLNDPEILRLEVEGVDITGSGRTDWADLQSRFVGSGIFMQALSNRSRYQSFADNISKLQIAGSSLSRVIAEEMGRFISSISSDEPKLKVLFLGSGSNDEYAFNCMDTLFAKRLPMCLFGLEDDSGSQTTSDYARANALPFTQLNSSLDEDSLIESIRTRCTHVFSFEHGRQSELANRLIDRLVAVGVTVTPIQQAAS